MNIVTTLLRGTQSLCATLGMEEEKALKELDEFLKDEEQSFLENVVKQTGNMEVIQIEEEIHVEGVVKDDNQDDMDVVTNDITCLNALVINLEF